MAESIRATGVTQVGCYRWRSHIHMTSIHKPDFAFVFRDRGETIATGSASTPRVVYLLFEEFKRGRLSAD
ncbi:hypothetical protein [Sabulicella glaciei]|uniref:Uncharacterized protein n=1 Tax=Sabulicella glaciei TaxID=2984948 RepID=A0ABT3P073_9PROT|nr:hypothetical protein [Roseococcus sp. MDT2-1-1]MCW8087807.1 hypothetical protein [Roseococcus sp. MDT2-1-1]